MRKMVLFALFALLTASFANADVVTLTFEGLQNQEQILDFYNGGTGSFGSSGTNYGINFGADSLALTSGNFCCNPTEPTIAFFLSGPGTVMNNAAGFDTGFSFFYTAAFTPGSVTVYDGLNGTGNVLATLVLGVNGACSSGPSYCNWTPVGVTFSGTAHSVNFSGVADQIGFDNITLGSETPGGVAVPEPATLALLGTGLVGAGIRRFRTAR